jgi:hypothetical protein
VGVANSRFASAGVALISETVLAADGQIDIQNIPQTFKHLWVVASCVRAVSANLISDNFYLRFNADAGGNYDYAGVRQQTGVVSAQSAFGQTSLRIGQLLAAATNANQRSQVDLLIAYYARADLWKVTRSMIGFSDIGAANSRQTSDHGQWRSNAAINRITFLGDAAQTDLGAGTRLSLYGLN